MGGYNTAVDGATIDPDDHNEFVRDQTVNQFASSAARSSAISVPTEGMVTTLADTDEVDVYDGSGWVQAFRYGSWQSGTATFKGSAGDPNLGSTGSATYRYHRVGRQITCFFSIKWGGSGGSTGSGYYYVVLPVACRTTGYLYIGTGMASSDAGDLRTLSVQLDNGSAVNARMIAPLNGSGSAATALGSGSAMGTTAPATIELIVTYEAAS